MKKIITQTARGRFVIEQFEDVYEFMDILNTRTENRHCRRVGYAAGKCESDVYTKWTGTASWQESIDLMAKGYDEGVRMIEEAPVLTTDRDRRPQPEPYYYGHKVHIANAVAGLPKSMVHRTMQERPSRCVTIYYDCVISVKKTVRQAAAAARMVLEAIAEIERRGTKVNLYIMNATTSKSKQKEYAICCAKLKDANARLNLKKVSYPMVHPSFSRRQCGWWNESQPDIREYSIVKPGYVSAAPLEEQRRWLIDAGLMTDRDYYMKCEDVINNIHSVEQLIAAFDRQSELKKAAAV